LCFLGQILFCNLYFFHLIFSQKTKGSCSTVQLLLTKLLASPPTTIGFAKNHPFFFPARVPYQKSLRFGSFPIVSPQFTVYLDVVFFVNFFCLTVSVFVLNTQKLYVIRRRSVGNLTYLVTCRLPGSILFFFEYF